MLRGRRVVLRPFEEADAALVARVADDPLIPLITTVPASGDAADVAAYLQRQHDRLTTGVGYSFAIALAGTDEGVGQIGLWTRGLEDGCAATGYWVAPAHRGRGLLDDALLTLVTWADTLDPVQRVRLVVEPWNEASWRAAESCGFERRELLRGWQQVGAERRDVWSYVRECR